MTDINFLTLSNYAGLIATALLTFNFLLGMMIGTAYKKHNYWKRLPANIKQISILDLHNWTAYVALLFVLLHPLLLLFDPATKFKFIDIIFPINAPHQKLFVAFGTLSMFAIITVIITTQKVIKKKMSFRTWKNIHLISYCTALLFFIHGIVLDPQLKDRPVDFFDAEKIVSEICVLILIVASIFRFRYHIKSKKKIVTIAIIFFSLSAYAQDSTKHFHYNPDAGLQFNKVDFQWTTWGFAERLFSPSQYPAWRRVRQGMEFQLPSYPFKINGNKFRTALVYEVDFTDNNFFKDSKRFKILENLFISFQNAKDAKKFRVLFGENTSILSREDNLSSGNLPTINRSLILEQHGSTNSFGTQWGFQFQSQVSKKILLQASLQDNRGSLNQDKPMYQFWNAVAVKITESILQPTDSSNQKLYIGFAIDHTRNIEDKNFKLTSAINSDVLGSTPATGSKLTFENNLDYTNTIGEHFFTLEYEAIYSNYSDQKLNVAGGYTQLQFQVWDKKQFGDMVPFVRYDLVNLSNPTASATEQAIRFGINYNFPFTNKLLNFHLEYARHFLNSSPSILTTTDKEFNEFRLAIRLSATRYLRF